MSEKQVRGKYTLEFKLEAVRLVKAGQSTAVTAQVLGIPKASLSNWVRLNERGVLSGAGDKPVTAEQMELARLRAELARMTMERDIAKKAAAQQASRTPMIFLGKTSGKQDTHDLPREDDCLIRRGHGHQNMATLRRIAQNQIKQDASKGSQRIKRKHMGWSDDYLQTIFGLVPCAPLPQESDSADPSRPKI